MYSQFKAILSDVKSRLYPSLLSEQFLQQAIVAVSVVVSVALLITAITTCRMAFSLAESANTAQGHDLFSALTRHCSRMLPGPDTANPFNGELQAYVGPCFESFMKEHDEILYLAVGGERSSKEFRGIEHSDLRLELGAPLAPRELAFDTTYRAHPFIFRDRGVMMMPPEITPPTSYRQTHILEYVPTRRQDLRRQGFITLIAGVLGALVTLGGAFFMRVLIRQREVAQRFAREQEKLAVLGRMSAVMAHELRNPLAAAKGRSELLVELSEAGSRLQARAQAVYDEITRVQMVTERLLDFVRSGEVRRKPSDAVSVARDAMERVGGTITLRVGGEIPTWSFDPYALDRVLVNLLRNAVQAQEGSSEPVILSVALDGQQLHLSVVDHGPGFPEGIELGAPFVTTRAGGTGLGLAVCRQIVQAHGGKIELGSAPAGGALVDIWLPWWDDTNGVRRDLDGHDQQQG